MNVLRLSFIFLGVAVELLHAQVQSNSVHSIGLQSGYLYDVNRDDLESPMRYSGGVLPLILSYAYRGEINLHSVRLSFRSGSLESVLTTEGDHRDDVTAGGIEYSYLHKIDIARENLLQTFLGVAWNNEAQVRNHTYIRLYGGDWKFYELYSWLSITGLAEYRISEREFVNARLSMPVAAYVLRPGYADVRPAPAETSLGRVLLKGGKMVSWGSFRGFALEAGYNYSPYRYLDLTMRYAIQFTYYSIPVPTMTFMGQFNLGLSVNL